MLFTKPETKIFSILLRNEVNVKLFYTASHPCRQRSVQLTSMDELFGSTLVAYSAIQIFTTPREN